MNSSCPGSVNLTSSQCNSIIKSGNHSLSDTDSENSLEIGLRCSTEQNIKDWMRIKEEFASKDSQKDADYQSELNKVRSEVVS